ncbi:hypothetical protein I4F81_004391 [Pyropia yezoensis]|uniref:Uncharacterized protein n=1 Tax=Pyropia yezoensis TaxID=2788 RepID=A0ACC3BUU4_PYRYE|nr:hypothetical protein I4F81_004391 [Neopyropia yezoensis]
MGTIYRVELAVLVVYMLLVATVDGAPRSHPLPEAVDKLLTPSAAAAPPLLRADVEVAQAPAEPIDGMTVGLAVLVPGSNIQEDSVACAGGGLVLLNAPAFFRPKVLESLGIQGIQGAVNSSAWHMMGLMWAEVIGVKLDSWTCGSNTVAPWGSQHYATFSDRKASISWGDEDITLEDGDRNLIIRHVGTPESGGGFMVCTMRAPPGGGAPSALSGGAPVYTHLHEVENEFRSGA